MKEKMMIGIIGGLSIIVISFPLYNNYVSPVIRHKEVMNKFEEVDKRLKIRKIRECSQIII